MALKAKTVCLFLMGIMGGALLFSLFCAFDSIQAYRLSKLGAQAYLITALLSVPVSILLAVVEWGRAQRTFRWPLILLAVSALPPLLLMAIFWNDPD